MILVTGATGALGAATIDFLLKKVPANQITALVRDEAKATALKEKGVQVRIGDYNNLTSLEQAFQGVDKLFFISGSELENRSQQHLNIVEAAKKAKVGQVVYTSFVRKNETDSSPIAFVAKSHLDAEAALAQSGIPYTLLRNGLYMDLLPMFVGEQVVSSGVVFQPTDDAKAAFVLRNDLAEASANILASDGHEGKVYDFSGSKAYSYGDVAASIAKATGKEVKHVSPSLEVYQSELTKAGVPAGYVTLLGGFGEAIRQGEFADTSETLADFLGRKPVSLDSFVSQVYSN